MAESEVGNLAVRLSLDSANFTQSMASIDRNLKAMGQEMRANQNLGREWGNSITGLTTRHDSLTRMLDAQDIKVRRLREAYERSRAETGENSAATENLATQLNRATAEYNRTETELNQVAAALQRQQDQLRLSQSAWTQLGETLTAVGASMKAVGDKMTAVGKDLSMKVTAPLVAAGLASVKLAADFEAQMSRVGAIAGATGGEMDALKKSAMELGANTSKSASEVAIAMEDMAAMGFNAVEIIGAMPGVISASEASGESLALAAQTVAAALNIWGLEATEAGRVADVLAMAANMSAAGIGDMQLAFKYAGAPAAALGIEMEEVAAAIGIMTDAGLDGSNAGTVLRASLLSLNNPAKAQEKIMKKLGFSILDSEGNAKSLSEMVGELSESLEGETEAQKVATLAKLVGTEAVSGFLALTKAGPVEIDKMSEALRNSAGESAKTAAVMKDNLKGALEELGGALETAAITIGNMLIPTIREVVTVLQGLVEKFTELSPATQKTILVIAGIAAAIGPVLVVAGVLVSSLGAIFTALGTVSAAIAVVTTGVASTVPAVSALAGVFTVLTGPIGIAVAAIVGIGAALILAYNKVEWFRDGVNATWDKIKELTTVAFEAIKKTVSTVITATVDFGKSQLDKFKGFWDENGAQITQIAKGTFDLLMKTVKSGMDFIKGVFQVVWPIISSVVKVAWELIKAVVKTSIDAVLGVVNTVLKILQGDWKGAWDTILKTVKTIWGNIEGFFKGVDLVQVGKDIIAGLIKGISSMVSAVGDAIKNVTSAITDTVKNILQIKSPSRVMQELGKHTGDGLAKGVSSTEDANKKAIEGVTKVLSTAAKKNAEEITKIATEAEKKRTEVQADFSKKRAELGRKSTQSSQAALKTSKNKKGEIVKSGEQKVHNIRADASAKLTKLNEDEQKKLTKINEKAWADMQKRESEVTKARLEAIKTYVADKKSLDELSIVGESEIWRKSLTLFNEGTKERVEIQKAYQASLKVINDEVTKTNEEYANKVTTINNKLRDEERKLTDEYTKSVDDRTKALTNLVGLFDEYDYKLEQSGQDLTSNLRSQVSALEEWSRMFEMLSGKAVDKGLLEELRQMGPKALPQLVALNQMTDKELTEYSELYKKRSRTAREQAEKEMAPMKANTEKQIIDLRAAANKELGLLQNDWTNKIKSITKTTDDELKSLKSIGRNAGQGLLDGLASMEGSLVNKARDIANAVSQAMASALQVKSPSRVTMRIGEFVGEGLEAGMDNSIASIRRAARTMANAAVPNVGNTRMPSYSLQGGQAGQSAPSGNSSPTINQTVVIHSPKYLSPSENARKFKQAGVELGMAYGFGR